MICKDLNKCLIIGGPLMLILKTTCMQMYVCHETLRGEI